MEMSLLETLLRDISFFLKFSSSENINSEPVQKYYQGAEEILKVLKPIILNAIFDSEITSDEVLSKAFEELGVSVEELLQQFERWQPLSSKAYFVLQVESLISEIRNSCLDIFRVLKSSHQHLPYELSSASLELHLQKIKHVEYEQTSSVIKEAKRDQVGNFGPSSEILLRIAESLSLNSNMEVLIEAVALEKLKENTAQAKKLAEVECIDQLIALITNMHHCLFLKKQFPTCSSVPIPLDFICPLSLELMTDPVIVASGQTYERAFIKKWFDLGLTVCPKTRQTLVHTSLIPNYTTKALIVNWCESNNVKLPDLVESTLNQVYPPRATKVKKLVEDLKSKSNNVKLPDLVESTLNQVYPPRATKVKKLVEDLKSTSNNVKLPDLVESTLNQVYPPRATKVKKLVEDLKSTSNNVKLPDLVESTLNQVYPPRATKVKKLVEDLKSTSNNVKLPDLVESTLNQVYPPRATKVKKLVEDLKSTSNNVKLPDLVESTLNQVYPPRATKVKKLVEDLKSTSNNVKLPDLVESTLNQVYPPCATKVKKLVEDLKSTSTYTQRVATAELRLLSKQNRDNRIIIANCGAISLLVDLLHSPDTKTQENAVTTLLNLSNIDNNKKAIVDANAIEPLIHVLQTGSPVAKENLAATLFSLSIFEINKARIGRSGAIRPLVDLLGNGTPRGKKDAAAALFNLSLFHENKAQIVQADAVRYLVKLLDPAAGMVDKAVAVLASLATTFEGRTAIGQEGGIPLLVEVVELGSARGKANATAALLQLCTNSSRFCIMVLQEGAVPPLVALSQSGTQRAKEKAQALLSYFQRHYRIF
ncbi:hypothetical protein GOBAR_DD12611 [Gossypium barbadense]|nr:hypothetical protein GOBAR_DD12611 [Gossypium barbadense]